MSEVEFSDEEDQEKEVEENNFSEQGKKMAASIAEYLLMKYFFPEMRDRKKQ